MQSTGRPVRSGGYNGSHTNYNFRPAVNISSSISDASSGSPVLPTAGVVQPSGGFLAITSPLRSHQNAYSDILNNFDHTISLQARTALPQWVLDDIGQVRLSMAEIMDQDLLKIFASDKFGCQFLVEHFPAEEEKEVRQKIVDQVLKNEERFESLCADVFGNFFVQKLIASANSEEQQWILKRLTDNMRKFCMERYSCRVVQKAMETLDSETRAVLMVELQKEEVPELASDQHASHVFQKIMGILPLSCWKFIVDFISSGDQQLYAVAENKYGCRVIQRALEVLPTMDCRVARDVLKTLMNQLILNCHRLAINDYANYIIQHMLTAENMEPFRERVIGEGILRQILSLSQEKFASHVVEKAFQCASAPMLREMMDEILYGYLPEPTTNRDALDIIMFHQYGNYVVQRMLTICVETATAVREGRTLPDMEKRQKWLQDLRNKIYVNESKLNRYSSGQRIFDLLRRCG